MGYSYNFYFVKNKENLEPSLTHILLLELMEDILE